MLLLEGVLEQQALVRTDRREGKKELAVKGKDSS